MLKNELGGRLKTARESLGLTLTEAAQKLGFQNYQTLKSIESGEREVKVSELSIFSRAYCISIGNLLDQKELQRPADFLWRNAPGNKTKKQIEATIYYRCEQYNLLERLLNLKIKKGAFPEVTIISLRTISDITNLAENVRDCLNLGRRPAFTLQKVLEQDFGMKILFEQIPEGSAVSLHHAEFGSIIVINSEEVPWRRNYDLAHELFHLITWKIISQNDLNDSDYFNETEKKADQFASILLLPAVEVKAQIMERVENQNAFTYSDLIDIAMEFGISAQALLYRMANLGIIEWQDANQRVKDQELIRLSRQKRQTEKAEKPSSERFISLAVRCLRKSLISRGQFAKIVGIDRSDIDDFILMTGLMEQEGTPLEIMAS